MIAGAIAFFFYAAIVSTVMMRYETPVLTATGSCSGHKIIGPFVAILGQRASWRALYAAVLRVTTPEPSCAIGSSCPA
jgi:hypothetical protein